MNDLYEDTKTRRDKEEVARMVVDCEIGLIKELRPGLPASVYEVVIAKMLTDEGFGADLLVDDFLLEELKSIERFAPIHSRQVLTYLCFPTLLSRLLEYYRAGTFKESIRRIVSGDQAFLSSCLRVNQERKGKQT